MSLEKELSASPVPADRIESAAIRYQERHSPTSLLVVLGVCASIAGSAVATMNYGSLVMKFASAQSAIPSEEPVVEETSP